ncbi:CsbD family protein [Echinicola sp. 20G]|uniref:CsbD family protein n=1 Tax=Echinicola sp. 20G TaxID=2781961 RepID=UPI0019105F50|nr:CsbD family protein [Echinicola sp. 20G]
MANNLKLKGNWNELKGKLKSKYGELTDDDLTYAEGQEDQLIGKIQKKTGESVENIKAFLFSEPEDKKA